MTKYSLNNKLMPKNRYIYLDEDKHEYTDSLGLKYTSCTTVVSKYCEGFDKAIAKNCERIGRNPSHPKYHLYKNKSYKQILKDWDDVTNSSCKWGSDKHNYFQNSINTANNYKGVHTNNRIYTIDDIIENHNYGKLSLKKLAKTGLKDNYPQIFEIIKRLSDNGYFIYSEICAYDVTYLISGSIDVLAINHKTNEFIILDWKTNKAPIRFDSGYYAKHISGVHQGFLDLNNWIKQDKTFKYPISHLADSIGNHYTMQLSIYAYLISTFGYTFKGLILCHIRPIETPFVPKEEWEEEITIYRIQYLEQECKLILDDNRSKMINTQTKMLI